MGSKKGNGGIKMMLLAEIAEEISKLGFRTAVYKAFEKGFPSPNALSEILLIQQGDKTAYLAGGGKNLNQCILFLLKKEEWEKNIVDANPCNHYKYELNASELKLDNSLFQSLIVISQKP
jgi:hypothetical protein